jgi:phosphatidate cytidylyltransferase
MQIDHEMMWLLGGVLLLLLLASCIGFVLQRKAMTETSRSVVENLNARVKAWWGMCAVFALALLTGGIGSVLLFLCTSFFALREFITLTPTRRGDHRTLFWIFFIFLPLQYWLVAVRWYGLFSILIPVYAFLFVPLRSALSGDTENFLERTAKIQWGLMICVYCVSHVPALLMLNIPGYEGQNAKLLMFFVLTVQISDVLQYVYGKLMGKRPIAPKVSPNKTWEGFIGGVLSSAAIGAGLWWITPFNIWQTAAVALLVNLMGFSGGLCMSAIKRDRGIKDFGTMLSGHGGILDRIDSICFAAPVYFHIIRYFFSTAA